MLGIREMGYVAERNNEGGDKVKSWGTFRASHSKESGPVETWGSRLTEIVSLTEKKKF